MTVTKRARHEVLRRDGYACRYCGAKAPSVPLTIDHILPVALGGTDAPDNLTAACKDCNAGKAATNPDAEVLAKTSDDALRWASAVRAAAELELSKREANADLAEKFKAHWDRWQAGGRTSPLPSDWATAISHWVALGVPFELLMQNVDMVMRRKHVQFDEAFTYFAGVAWSQLTEFQEAARTSLAAPAIPPHPCVEDDCPYDEEERYCGECRSPADAFHPACCATYTSNWAFHREGMDVGFLSGRRYGLNRYDFVAAHIDKTDRLDHYVAEHVHFDPAKAPA